MVGGSSSGNPADAMDFMAKKGGARRRNRYRSRKARRSTRKQNKNRRNRQGRQSRRNRR